MKKYILIFCFLFFLLNNANGAVVKVEKKPDGWQLSVDGEDYFIKGVSYSPSKIGESPDEGNLRDWMMIDDDKDGRIDVAYQSWIDKNRNNKKDSNEPEVGDFQLLKEMGVNTIRIYHHATGNPEIQKIYRHINTYNHPPNKVILKDLYEKYGIRVMMGDFLGAYTIGSGAEWKDGTDYTDLQQRENMLKSVEDMVAEFKEEPFLLMWALGNDNNNEESRTNASTEPLAYAAFVNEVAKRIHELDPHHPVVLVNCETMLLDIYAQHTPDVDIIGINSFRSIPGFGTLFHEVATKYDKPLLITEYGTQRPLIVDNELDEINQMQVHIDSWRDISNQKAGKNKPGNTIGGFAFEWMDTWWRNWNPGQHNLSQDGWHLEWHGIVSQGNGQHSLLLRQLRNVYFAYQEMWTKEN